MAQHEARHVLAGLYDRLDKLCFEIKEKDGVRYVNSFDRAFGFIDDTLVIVNDLRSETITPLADREALQELGKSLSLLNDVLEKFGRCQSQVLYLHPLFAGSPEGAVLKQWDETMDALQDKGSRARTLVDEKWVVRVSTMNHDFENLCLSLGDLTNEHQVKVNRFYFCSTDEVLTIISLAQTVGFTGVTQFFRRLFHFHFVYTADDDTTITDLCSEDGEVLPLMEPVGTNLPFHVWIGALETQMRLTMKQCIAEAVESFSDVGFRNWAMLRPAQCMLLAVRIYFTKQIDTTFKLHTQAHSQSEMVQKEFHRILGTVSELIDDVILWVRGGNRMQRVRLLLATLLSIKEGVAVLITENVRERNSVLWMRQPRWYLEVSTHDDDTDMEYITEVTDAEGDRPYIKIYMNQLQASFEFHGEYNGVLHRSPLGAGGNETMASVMNCFHVGHVGCIMYPPCYNTKPDMVPAFDAKSFLIELAQTMGKKWEVVTCTPEATHANIARLLTGTFASGVWLIFEDIDQLDPAILSIINEGVCTTQSAIVSKSPTYQFEGKVVPLVNHTFGVFGILSGKHTNEVTRHGIELLKRALPPVAVPLVTLESVLRLNFILTGADDSSAEMLSRYAASVFERLGSSGLDIDLTLTLKQFLQTLSHVVQVVPICDHPVEAVVNGFLKTLLRQLHPLEYEVLMGILRSCFGTTEGMDIPGPDDQLPLGENIREFLEAHLESMHLLSGKLFVGKCEQLYESAKCGTAVVLKGPPASGKTTMWQSVHAALIPKATCKLINVRLFSHEAFFGKVDVFNEWNDGPFTHIFRSLAQTETSTRFGYNPPEMQWIILDGKPSPEILATLLPIIDPQNRCLTLDTGEVIRAPSNLKLIFEMGSEEDLPKELKETCWLVRTDGDVLTASDYIRRHAMNPNFFLARYKNQVIEILSNLVPPMIEWAEEAGLVRDWNNDKDPKTNAVAFFPLNCSNLVTSCFNVINGFKNKRKSTRYSVDAEKGIAEAVVEPIILFSCVWSFGAALAVGHGLRVAFNQFFRNLIIDKGVTARFPMPMGDELGLVFDYLYDVEQRMWVRWSVLPAEKPPDTIDLTELFMSASTSVRLHWMLTHLTDKAINVLVVGPPATAKQSILSRSLRHSTTIHCSNTMPHDIETTVGAKLQKSRDNVIRLPDKLNKPLTMMLESLELAHPTCLEFIRQFRDNKGWYDPYSNELLAVHDIAFAATVDSQGLLQFSDRDLQGFHFVSVYEPQADELVEIVRHTLDSWAAKNDSLRNKDLAKPLAAALIDMYLQIKERYTPEMNGKCIWTLATIQAVLQGVYSATPHLLAHAEDVIRLFINECRFAFAGRFEPRSGEYRWVDDFIWDTVLLKFPKFTRKDIMKQRKELWFGGVEKYRDFKTRDLWTAALIEGSEKYMESIPTDEKRRKQKLLQTLLSERETGVLHNLTQLLRVFRIEGGHALLLTDSIEANMDEVALASFLCDAHLFCPQLTAYHTTNDWREVLKHVCITAFVSGKPCVVVLEEHNLPEECICDVGTLIKCGDLMGLFSAHEWNSIALTVGKMLEEKGEVHHGKDHIKELVRKSLLSALHFIVVKDPEGKGFRECLDKHVSLQTHLCPLVLHQTDRQHLRMCVMDACGEDITSVVIELFEACKECLDEIGAGTHGICRTAETCCKMAKLAEKVLKDLLSTNEAQKMKYQRCLASVEAFTEENEWPRCKMRWKERLETIANDTKLCQGNALLLAAVITWGAGLGDRASLINRCKKVLRVNRIPFDEVFNPGAIYKNAVMRDDVDRWVDGGVPRCLLLSCIALQYCPGKVALVTDPHHVAMSCLKTMHGGGMPTTVDTPSQS